MNCEIENNSSLNQSVKAGHIQENKYWKDQWLSQRVTLQVIFFIGAMSPGFTSVAITSFNTIAFTCKYNI